MKSWDQNSALDAVGGDAQFLNELAGIFCAAVPSLLKSLEESVSAKAANQTADTAHLLWSSARNFSAPEAVQAAIAVESMARRKRFAGIENAINDLRREVVQLVEALTRFRQEQAWPSGGGRRSWQ